MVQRETFEQQAQASLVRRGHLYMDNADGIFRSKQIRNDELDPSQGPSLTTMNMSMSLNDVAKNATSEYIISDLYFSSFPHLPPVRPAFSTTQFDTQFNNRIRYEDFC